MATVLVYLQVFLIGGLICLIGQIIMNNTKLTPARILVMFMLTGAILELFGIFKYLEDFGKAGATVPITGFGSLVVKGAIKGVQEKGVLGAIGGGLEMSAVVLSAVIIIALIVGLIFPAKTKK
ncbi:MAG: SpoVA/SpoVAEb family sporulation membrane protein [Firmicutes bacterium]|nr:SpoVA/SpoVAEb family sporulation membrane protein [Bacillota bacterium]